MYKKYLTSGTYINIPSGIDKDKIAPCRIRYNQKIYEYYGGAKQVRLYSKPLEKTLLERKKKKKKRKRDFEEEANIRDCPFMTEEEKEEEIEKLYKNTIDKEGSIKRSKSRTINSIYSIARSNKWDYFFTLTLDPQKIDRTNYDEITKELKKWLNNLKHNYSRDLKYLIIPELHKDGKSFHFHGLMSEIGDLTLQDSGKSYKNKVGDVVKIYNLKEYKLGFSNFQKVSKQERVTKYITKYISKELCAVTEGKKRYWASKNVNRPKVSVDMVNIDDEYMKMIIDCASYIKSVDLEGTKQIVTYVEIPGDD
ncbi:MAG: hypothetical protein K6F35_07970 [Lachnospiraceae bacterium]|nr:hypothetical protein [Lachnospiraceae bacterium]